MHKKKINFRDEILNALKKYNKTAEDVLFVTDSKCHCSFSNFLNIIKDYKYDDSYGLAYIHYNLKIVGSDWWLERGEYDGAEWWEFKTLPTKPEIESLSIKWKCAYNYSNSDNNSDSNGDSDSDNKSS